MRSDPDRTLIRGGNTRLIEKEGLDMYEFSEYMEKKVMADMTIEEVLSLKSNYKRLLLFVDLLKSRKNGEDEIIAKELKLIGDDVMIVADKFLNVLEGLYYVETEEDGS